MVVPPPQQPQLVSRLWSRYVQFTSQVLVHPSGQVSPGGTAAHQRSSSP
jgi:hypothetical protein